MIKKNKKNEQLGMNYSTASNRLVKDILFKYIKDTKEVCFQCKGDLERDTFSIEHKKPWLDSEDPLHNFFDLNNIAFSHLSCNVAARRVPRLSPEDKEISILKNKEYKRKFMKDRYTSEARRIKYVTKGY